MANVVRDLHFALRMLSRRPGFSALTIVTLAVGIGANTAIFSVADALLLRPLPYRDPGRLVMIGGDQKSTATRGGPLSWPRFTFIRDHSRSFSAIAAFTPEVFNLTGTGDPEQIAAARVSWNFFDVLGVSPALGRSFRRDEDRPGGDPVVLISASFWKRRFAGDRAALGRHITLDSRDYTVVGVLPAGFHFGFFGATADVIAPRVFDLNLISPEQVNRGTMFLSYVARLAPGVSIRQAQTELDALSARYRRGNPKLPDADPTYEARARDLRDSLVFAARPAVLILFGAVTLVLLIACANVASLLLARALGRSREIAVRLAVGAGRAAIVRQMLVESLSMSLIAGALAAGLNAWTLPALVGLAGSSLPRAAEIRTDPTVLAFTLALSAVAAVLFGLAPAAQASGPDVTAVLRAEGRGVTAGRNRRAPRNLLVVAQVALSTVLLIGAGLLLKNFVQLRSAARGFDSRDLLTMNVALPPSRYQSGQKMTAFYDALLATVRALPGVRAAAISSALPANPARFSPALPEGQPEVPLMQRPIFNIQTVSPGYVEAMRVPLVRGREFTAHDEAGSPRVAIVNETLARRYWPGEDAIGKHILLGRVAQPFEVVGVLGDIRNIALAADVQPEICLPFAQLPWPAMNLLARTAGDPLAYASAIRSRVLGIDRDQPVTGIQTMDEVFDNAAARPRFTAALLGALAAIALVLALAGIYGVIAWSVAERTQEIGIRMAVGAAQGEIVRSVLWHGQALVLSGIAGGVAASLALTRLMTALLYHVSATDFMIYAMTATLFAIVGALASAIPALRAARMDPMAALRT